MPHNFAGVSGGDQVYLLPPDPREWLPPGHLAWTVRAAVAEMDLAPFVAWYRADGQGKRAYHPRLMVALIMYCYCTGIRSSRAVEIATYDDVGARVICENYHPDHATIARFVSRHAGPVQGLLVASLVACARQGLVSVEVVAGDGTKVKANASMAASATAAQLDAEIGQLEALITAEAGAWLEQARAADAAEDALFGGGPPGCGGGPGTLAGVAAKLARRQQARARLAAEAAARQQQAQARREREITRQERRVAARRAGAERLAGLADARAAAYQRRAAGKAATGSAKRPPGRPPVGAGRHAHASQARDALAAAEQALAQAKAAPAVPARPARPPTANTTDPASRVMPGKKGGYQQAHNAQVIATRHQVILAIASHGSATDTGALHPMLAAAHANLAAAGISAPIGKALFDAGYASHRNFTTASGPELYVAVTREARQTGRTRGGKPPQATKASWQQMAARLDTPEGKAVYRQRAAIIEPVFAQLFHRLGRHLNCRGDRVTTELHLWAASHNLLKAIRTHARLATS
jgi:transposase